MNDTTHTSQLIAERLSSAPLFMNYRDAFVQTTGLRLTLDAASVVRRETSIPSVSRMRIRINAGDEVMAYLSLQPVAVLSTEYASFDDVARAMLEEGQSAAEVREAHELYAKLPHVDSARFHAYQTLLETFAVQLTEAAERVFLQATESEPDSIRKARSYIKSHLGEPLALEDVANFAGVSPFHFCKVFKKSTGFTFTEFVSRARVDQAKQLLLKPRSRITEVAYDVGFQSLSQFNRSFRRVTSQSPTEYRNRVNHDAGLVAA